MFIAVCQNSPTALLLFLEGTWKKIEARTRLLSSAATGLEKSFQIAQGASIALFSEINSKFYGYNLFPLSL